MWAVIIIELLILAVICVLVLRVVANFKKTPWYALISTWLGWLLCFMIVLLLPIDILDTDHENCLKLHDNKESECSEPLTYLPDNVMRVQWRVLYWGTFVLSWLGFPIMQSYFLAGDFTVRERLVRSIKENTLLYVVLGIIGICFLVGLAVAKSISGEKLLDLVMALANAYGLILVVCLMGYGLVDIPRYLYRKADRERTLVHYHVQAYKYKEAMDKAKDELMNTLKVVKKLSDRIRDHDPYRPYVDTILSKCPLEFDDVTAESDWNLDELTYSKLVTLNCDVMSQTHNVARSVCLYEVFLKKAFAIEDILKEKEAEVKSPDMKMHWSFRPPRTHQFAHIVDKLEYIWQIYLYTTVFRIIASFATLLSLAIVWCEITLVIYNKVNLSPFAKLIAVADLEGFMKQVFCFIPLTYMAICAYTTLFKIKILNYYRLVPHQMSDANSIMFSANYLCRLAAPLSYNFLRLVNQPDSAFTAVMGNMDAFPFLGKEFTIFFPIFVALLCLATLFRVWSKIGSMCCIAKLRYQPEDDVRLAEEGAQILKEEREKKEGKVPQAPKSLKENIYNSIKKVSDKITGKNGADVEDATSEKQAASSLSTNNSSASKSSFSSQRHAKSDISLSELPASSRFAQKYGREESSSNGNTSTSRYSSKESYDDLLPPTSKFARSSAPPRPSAILTEPEPVVPSRTTMTESNKKSFLGGIFGGGSKSSSIERHGNDSMGLLPRGGPRSDAV